MNKISEQFLIGLQCGPIIFLPKITHLRTNFHFTQTNICDKIFTQNILS